MNKNEFILKVEILEEMFAKETNADKTEDGYSWTEELIFEGYSLYITAWENKSCTIMLDINIAEEFPELTSEHGLEELAEGQMVYMGLSSKEATEDCLLEEGFQVLIEERKEKIKKNTNMTKEFKTILAPYLFEDGEFCPRLGLEGIREWPQIKIEWDEEEILGIEQDKEEELDTENIEIISYTETTLTVCCGGDWQEPHTVTIGLVDGELTVTSWEQTDFNVGINEDKFAELFKDIKKGKLPEPPKSKLELQREMNYAIQVENYEEAGRIRDILKDL